MTRLTCPPNLCLVHTILLFHAKRQSEKGDNSVTHLENVSDIICEPNILTIAKMVLGIFCSQGYIGGSGVRFCDSPDPKLIILVGWGRNFFVCCLVHRGQLMIFNYIRLSMVLFDAQWISICHHTLFIIPLRYGSGQNNYMEGHGSATIK